MTNSKGPRQEPQGTPQSSGNCLEGDPSMETCWLQFDRYELHQSSTFPLMPTSLRSRIMINCVKCGASIQQDHQGHMLQVHFQEDVVHNFEQGRFSAAILTMGRLQIRIDFIDDHVLVPFHWNTAFLTSLEMYCRLLTGLTLWKTKSSPSFFSKGWTSPHIPWSARWTPLDFLDVTVFLVEYIAGKYFLFISLKEELDLSLFISRSQISVKVSYFQRSPGRPSIAIRSKFIFLFIGRQPTTWPANNYL